MKKLLVFLAVVCIAYGAWETGLRVKFNVGLRPGTDFFFPIPYTLDSVASEGWTAVERPSGLPLSDLVMYCPNDRIVCAMFDPEGNIAGMQVAIVKSQVTGDTLDWPTQGFTSWTATNAAGETQEFWTTQLYFVTEEQNTVANVMQDVLMIKETLKLSKEERVRAFERTGLMREGGVWLSGFYGDLLKVSNKYDDIANSIFTRQACIPWMGRHYYYNMTADALCTSDQLFPWFPIVHDGELLAVGLIMHGKHTVPDGQRDWYEEPNKIAVQAIVPNGAQCLYDMADSPGIITMHIYFVDKPWWISCLFN